MESAVSATLGLEPPSFNLGRKNTWSRSWRGGCQRENTSGEEFDLQHPYRKLGVVARASNPNTGEVETGRSLRFTILPD